MYKLIFAFVLMSLPLSFSHITSADNICFIGSPSPLTGHPGATFPVNADTQPIVDEAGSIKSAFDVSAPLYESQCLDDFSDRAGYVYIGAPLVQYLTSQNGDDPNSNGISYILAHEYAHQFQFKIWNSGHDIQPKSTRLIELQADVIAGIWLGINDRQVLSALRLQVGPSFDRQAGIDDMISKTQHATDQIGDYVNWTSDVHGTSDQRNDAVKAGVIYGENIYQASPAMAFKTNANEIYDFSKATAKQVQAD